jgi:hypothetical protein
MADLTDYVDPIAAAIFEKYEERGKTEQARTYLGASVIGAECSRALWYGFRWAAREQFDGRTLRLFQTGHLAESRFVADLMAIGVKVFDADPATGKQFGFSDHGGHMRGHMDGCAQWVPGGGKKWYVCEFKTHSAKSFSDLKKNGVKKAKSQHYDQMTWYMGQSGMDRALYLAVNKDNDDLYSERIEFDPTRYAQIQAKAESIIFAQEPPARISEDPKFYLCNWCAHSAVCHGGKMPAVSCRTCVHSTPERTGDARWSCAKVAPDLNISSIPVNVQRTGCDQHLPLPFLVTYADAIDAGQDWILFKRKDTGATFVVAAKGATVQHDAPIYTTHELSAAQDHRAIANPEIENLRNQFQGHIVG